MTTDTTPQSAARPKGFAGGYGVNQSGHDEMLEPDGALRAHWRLFVDELDALGPTELPRRWEQARRLIRENGITHNVYGDPNGLDRPWSLDLVPLLIPSKEWQQVSAALVQRAKLLNMLMADLYGPALSVAEGFLPPELYFGNPGFLRPCHGMQPPRGQWLHLYAADIVRSVDGQFRVLMDRTQSPSGAGYCLENRIVLGGVLPTIFSRCNVYRLATYFHSLKQTLLGLARPNAESPRVVLLTPGPYNETYFEHSYLARYLGYMLVQGNDLTVRDGRVFLKTLGGLQRVDVILRRVDDDYCDPLELYPNSFLGVPGLVEAVREGNVAVANALGSGILQTPAYLPFLPALCRRFLGEDLLMPSVATWWCGDGEARRYVLQNLRNLVIKPAFPTAGSDPEFGQELSQSALEQLAARINARPADFVAQERVLSRTAPVLLDNHVEARRFVVRSFVVSDPLCINSYSVMPGALTRVTASNESMTVSLQKGGGSKDTWILADGPVPEMTLLSAPGQPPELNRGGGDLPSRIADDLFWLGRYVQRADDDVRVSRSLFTRILDPSRDQNSRAVAMLAELLLGYRPSRLDERGADVLVSELFGPGGAGALRSSISHLRGLIRGLRDRVSSDAWRVLQSVENDIVEFDAHKHADQIAGVISLLNRLAVGFLAFNGVVAESMTRGQAWRFLDIGNRLERALYMARLVRAALVAVTPEASTLLDVVLEIADSALTYRRRYLTQLDTAAVVDLVVTDEDNPRAVAFQVAAIDVQLACLPFEAHHPQRNLFRQRISHLRAKLRFADLRVICKPAGRERPALASLMTECVNELEEFGELLSQTYFSHAAVSRRLNGPGEAALR